MNYIYPINDRVFWIYFMVTALFMIIGASFLYTNIAITITWIVSLLILLLVIYHLSSNLAPNEELCILDNNVDCFALTNRSWFYINLIYVILLILSLTWAIEFNNADAGYLRSSSGILILLVSLILISFAQDWIQILNISYFLIWFILTLIVTI